MKIFIRNIFFRCCYWLGFYPTKIYSPNKLYIYLKSKPALIREYELRKTTSFAALAKDKNFYGKILKKYIPDWDIEIKEAHFINNGIGKSEKALNCYRKVITGNQAYLEKVYFNFYNDLKAVQWFQKNIYELIKDQIKAPLIQKIYSGELLTIAYYEYFNLKELSEEEKEGKAIQISKDLYSITSKEETLLSTLKPPESMLDFSKHFGYQKYIYHAKNKLQKSDINYLQFENAAQSSKQVLTHGDIQETNIFEDNVLIDWDSFGIYPLGLDPAYLYFRLLSKDNKRNDFKNWLKNHYKELVLAEDWEDFERNFIYFLFIFSMKLFETGQSKNIEQGLTEKLYQYNSK